MLNLTRKKLLTSLSDSHNQLSEQYEETKTSFVKKELPKEAYLSKLYYILKKEAIVKSAANRITIKKGEITNLILAGSSEELLSNIRASIREEDFQYTGKLNLVTKTELRVFAERFKKCLKEHDAELIINQ